MLFYRNDKNAYNSIFELLPVIRNLVGGMQRSIMSVLFCCNTEIVINYQKILKKFLKPDISKIFVHRFSNVDS